MEQNEPKNGEITLETLATMIKGGFDDARTEMLTIEKNIREDMQLGFASVNRRMDSFVEKVSEHEERFAKMDEEK